MLEKFLMKVPSVAGKMEQFYQMIVEISLDGHEDLGGENDPDNVRINRSRYSLVKSLKHSEWIRRR